MSESNDRHSFTIIDKNEDAGMAQIRTVQALNELIDGRLQNGYDLLCEALDFLKKAGCKDEDELR